MYCVLFSPLRLKFVPDWPAVSVSSWQQVWGKCKRFGLMSYISRLASRVGARGGVGQWAITLQIITLPGSGRGAGKGVAFPPLDLLPMTIVSRKLMTCNACCRPDFFMKKCCLHNFPWTFGPLYDCSLHICSRAQLFSIQCFLHSCSLHNCSVHYFLLRALQMSHILHTLSIVTLS
jgi:hypothetical protein